MDQKLIFRFWEIISKKCRHFSNIHILKYSLLIFIITTCDPSHPTPKVFSIDNMKRELDIHFTCLVHSTWLCVKIRIVKHLAMFRKRIRWTATSITYIGISPQNLVLVWFFEFDLIQPHVSALSDVNKVVTDGKSLPAIAEKMFFSIGVLELYKCFGIFLILEGKKTLSFLLFFCKGIFT